MSFSSLLSEIRQTENFGRTFELFCKWFLLNDPYWKTQVDEVWLWDDWPHRWDRDKGVDLIFKHRNGEMWAVQAKCYAETTRISKEDIDSFLSDSNREIISKRLLMASTNAIGRNAIETMAGQEKPVIQWLLDDFDKSAIVYPPSLVGLKKPADKKTQENRPYQQEAVDEVVKGLAIHDRGQLIMACGTGKTFVTLWIKERIKPQTTVVFLPSLNLLSQTLHEWTSNSRENFEVLCVCSDSTVGKDDTKEDVRVSEVPFDVTSDVRVIQDFLNSKKSKVIFCTYQSSDLIGTAQSGSTIDLIICDEAHRCAGPATSAFTKVLNDEFIDAKKRLFTTATPRVFSKATMESAGARGHQIYGMDDEETFGPVIHTYSFAKAIEDKWLTDYQVLIVGVDEPTIQNYIENREIVASLEASVVSDAKTLAAKLSLLKATAEYDLRRVISFHGRVKAAKEFAAEYYDLVELVEPSKRPSGTIWTDYVSGEMKAVDRKRKIQRLKKLPPTERGLLANARCLAEGVDVPSLDGVAFIDPKGSQIDIIQAVGRALRKSDDKDFGTILIPVFIEPGEDPFEALEASNFKPVWEVIKALRSHDERLGQELDILRTELGKTGRRLRELPSNIIFDLPVSIDVQFSEALSLSILEYTSASWNFWFGLLEAFIEEHGHARPGQAVVCRGHKLGNWVINLRQRPERLSVEQKIKLETLPGWVWDTKLAQWEEGFAELKHYCSITGNALVQSDYTSNSGYRLGAWVRNQRGQRLDKHTTEQKQRLEALPGWSWNTQADKWDRFINALEDFLEKEKHLLVPYQHKTENGFPLGLWVSRIRSRYFGNGKYSKSPLSLNQIKQLEALEGWIWDAQEHEWEIMYSRLKRILESDPQITVSRNAFASAGEAALGKWIQSQRSRKRKETIPASQIKKLDALPQWSWHLIDEAWERGFSYLNTYLLEFGSADPKGDYVSSDGFKLGSWCHSQKQKYKANRGRLNESQIKRLEQLKGWIWHVTETAWDRNFESLKQFVERNGHARVPTYYQNEDGAKIGLWVGNQRGKYKAKLLNKSRIKLLESLPGWVWNAIDIKWEEGLVQLEKFAKEHGHASPKPKYVDLEGFGLGIWVGRQRSTRDVIDKEKRQKLEALPGWVWHADDARFETGLGYLRAYVLEFQSCRVPATYVNSEGYRLGQWVNQQFRTREKMARWRAEKLEAIPGWAWSRDEMS